MWMDEPHIASSATVIHIEDKIPGWAADAKPHPTPPLSKNRGARDCPAGSGHREYYCTLPYDLPIPQDTLVAESKEEEGRDGDSHWRSDAYRKFSSQVCGINFAICMFRNLRVKRSVADMWELEGIM